MNTLVLIIAAVLFLFGAMAIGLRMRALQSAVTAALRKEKEKRDNLAPLTREIESLRSAVGDIARLLQQMRAEWSAAVAAMAAGRDIQPLRARTPALPEPAEVGVERLVELANGVVQDSPTTIDAVRAKASVIRVKVSAWPNASSSQPVAFIIEHQGAYYGVPNIAKPKRLPQEWFNSAEFAVNDEIQRIVSLPRLMRRGNDYDVQERGVFAK
jgi:hypothetical protein